MENEFYTELTQPDNGALNIKFIYLLFPRSFTEVVCLAEHCSFDN